MSDQIMDNNSYNIIQALASNLEAHDAYHKYAKDGNQQLWEQLAQQTEQNVQMLQQALMQTMGSQSQGTQSYGASQPGMSGSTGSSGQGGSSGQNYNSSQGAYGAQTDFSAQSGRQYNDPNSGHS